MQPGWPTNQMAVDPQFQPRKGFVLVSQRNPSESLVYFCKLLVTTGDTAIKAGRDKHFWVSVDMDSGDKIVIFKGGSGFKNTFRDVFNRPCWRMRAGQVIEVRTW